MPLAAAEPSLVLPRPVLVQPWPRTQAESRRLAVEHWRVFAGLVAAQVAGAVVSWSVVRPYGEWFFDLWIGGAVAGAAGALAGAAWHVADPARRARAHVPLLLFVIALSVAVPLFGGLAITDEVVRSFSGPGLLPSR